MQECRQGEKDSHPMVFQYVSYSCLNLWHTEPVEPILDVQAWMVLFLHKDLIRLPGEQFDM